MSWFARRSRRGAAGRDVDGALRGALLALLAGDDERAESELTRLLRGDSTDVEAYLALAQLYRRRGEVGRALRVHQNLLLRPDVKGDERVTALAELATDLHEGGYDRRALAAYEEVLTHAPRHRKALAALVDLCAGAGDYARAIGMLRRRARVDGRKDPEGEAQLLLAMARSEQAEGRADAARKLLKRALRKHRDLAEAHELLGDLEAERGKPRAAIAAWQAALRASGRPRSGRAALYDRLESAWVSQGKSEQAERFLRERIDEAPDDDAARLALARALCDRGEIDPAIQELRRLLDAAPDNLEARAVLGRLLLTEHRDTDALKEYGELLEVLGAGPEPDDQGSTE